MPVMGPGNNEENAAKAFEEVMKLFEEKYYIDPQDLMLGDTFQGEMDAEIEKLKTSIAEIFRIHSWDGF